MRTAARADDNQAAIVQALRDAGFSVDDTSRVGKGFPDLVVGVNGKTLIMEIKNPSTRYGRQGWSGRQEKWLSSWRGGPVALVTDVESALRAARTAAGA
jgi:hypothetical protein